MLSLIAKDLSATSNRRVYRLEIARDPSFSWQVRHDFHDIVPFAANYEACAAPTVLTLHASEILQLVSGAKESGADRGLQRLKRLRKNSGMGGNYSEIWFRFWYVGQARTRRQEKNLLSEENFTVEGQAREAFVSGSVKAVLRCLMDRLNKLGVQRTLIEEIGGAHRQ